MFDRILIIGCGDLGGRVARLWQGAGVPVIGVVRGDPSVKRLHRAGVTPIRADLDRPATLGGLNARGALVYYLAPPPRAGSRETRLANLLAAWSGVPERWVHLSTTAVYGDCGGAWVDEGAPLRPTTDRGRRRLDGEQRLAAWAAGRDLCWTVLRVPGIYGPGRLPLARLRSGRPLPPVAESGYTNRIHVDDLAAACVAAARRGRCGAAYNISDGNPLPFTEYFRRVARACGLPPPPEAPARSGAFGPEFLSYLRESRRIDNRRMREELGVELRYPDLDTALAGLCGSPARYAMENRYD